MRIINDYQIEKRGGGSFVKRWVVYKDEWIMRVFFSFSQAKWACENEDFTGGMEKDIY